MTFFQLLVGDSNQHSCVSIWFLMTMYFVDGKKGKMIQKSEKYSLKIEIVFKIRFVKSSIDIQSSSLRCITSFVEQRSFFVLEILSWFAKKLLISFEKDALVSILLFFMFFGLLSFFYFFLSLLLIPILFSIKEHTMLVSLRW